MMKRTLAGVCAVFPCLTTLSMAAPAGQPVELNIDAPMLARALIQFTEQTGFQVIFPAEDRVTELRTQPLAGSYTPRVALGRLLEGSGLDYEIDGAMVIVRAKKPASPVYGYTAISTAQQNLESHEIRLAQADTATAGAAPASASSLEEIVVTAQRVSEPLQRTALAIQALSAQDIARQGAVTPEELGKLVPSMNIVAGGQNTIYLRGLGANSAGGFGQNSVAFNVDGIGLSQQAAVNGNFFDLERIEVLKGPQGTLYGRNASAGAINVVSKNPGQELGGNLNVEVGNYREARVDGALNVPLTETLAVRGAIYTIKRDGYMHDGSDNDDQVNGRFKALWTPNESLRVLLAYSQSEVHTKTGPAGTQTPRPAPNGDVRLGPTDPLVSDLLTSLGGPQPNPKIHSDVVNRLAYATVDLDMGFATLTYIPAYGWSKQCLGCAVSVVPYPAQDALGTHIDSHQLSNELRLAHTGDRFKYVGGLFQFSEREEMNNLYYLSATNGSGEQHIPKLDTDSYAAFGELTFSLTDTFRAIGGVRYTHDKKEVEGTAIQAGPLQRPQFHPGNPAFVVGPDPVGIGDGMGPGATDTGVHEFTIDNSGTSSQVNWKAGLEYDVSPTSFLFATVATGYKGGIFYPGPAPKNLSEPEHITAYTVGSKNRFLDNSLQINAEAFYWKFKDQQVSGIGIDSSGSLNYITYNAGASTIYGANLDVQWRITAHDLFRMNVEYDHAYYDDYSFTTPIVDSNGLGGGCPFSVSPSSTSPTGVMFSVDCSNKHMVFAPDWSGNVSYGHDFSVGGGNTLHAEVNARFNSWQYLQQNWNPEGSVAGDNSRMPGYVMWDASLEYAFADKPISVALWGRNLGDKVVYTSADGSNVPGVWLSNLQAPRTFGVRLNVSF